MLPFHLYGSTFLCNVTLVLGPLGLYDPHYRGMTQAHCIAIGIDQLLWGCDLTMGCLFDYFPIGLSKYLFSKQTAPDWITPWHHLWTIPLFLWAMQLDIPQFTDYLLSIVVIAANVVLSRWLTPKSLQHSKHQRLYLNVNLSHELWSDVKIPILQLVNRYQQYAPSYIVALLWRWAILNFLVFAVLRSLCQFLHSQYKQQH